MPTTTSVTTTYAGVFAKKYIGATMLASKTIDNVTQHLNINSKYVIGKLANAASFANLTCDFTPTGTVTKTEIILDPKQLQWQLTQCKKDYLADWEAMEMGFGNNRVMPKFFFDFLLEQMAETSTAQFEILVWQGEAANAGEFDGFYAQMTGGPDVAGTVINAGNVIAELGKVVAAIPTAVLPYRSSDLTIYVPPSVIIAYEAAQSALGAADMFHERQATPNFRGFTLTECPGMLDNTMVAARKSNMHFATGLLADYTDVKVIDMADIEASENVRISLKFSGDTAIGLRDEVVYYAIQS